jgi:hypothetical protein
MKTELLYREAHQSGVSVVSSAQKGGKNAGAKRNGYNEL